MKLTSSAFKEGESIPRIYSCQGGDHSPELEIHAIPEGTESLVLIMDDPDVPPNVRPDRMYVHWVAYDIPPSTKKIPQDAGAFATLGQNTAGENRYVGPCPPDREHRYFFKLYALDKQLNLPKGKTKEELLEAMVGHILAEAQLMGRYEKS